MATEIEREISRLSNLINYKDIDPNELEQIANKNIICREFKKNPLFIDDEEQKLAETLFRNYINAHELESTSDIDTLQSLVFNQIFEQRIQGELNKLKKDGKYPPDKLVKTLVDVQNQKASLKVKLGIDRKEDKVDDFSALELLQKRVDKHINENKSEFSVGLGWQCDKCGYKDWESFLLYKKTKDFDIIKHPFYSGRYLFSLPLIKLVKNKILTKEQATEILLGAGMSNEWQAKQEDYKWCTDYISWCIENYTELKDLCTRK